MNMSRWAYLIPRAAIAGLILLSFWMGRDPLIRSVLVHQTQALTGAKAEFGQVRSALPSGKLFLKDVRIADPQEPMKNLLQADMAYVQLKLEPLLWRRFVIENGQANQLMFGAPRTESGALSGNHAFNEAQLPPEKNRDFKTELSNIGQAWLDQLPPTKSTANIDSLKVPQLLAAPDQLSIAQLAAQLASYRSAIAKLEPRLEAVRKSLSIEYQNPLRDPKRYAVSAAELAAVSKQSADLQNEILELQNSVVQEKEKWGMAGRHDLQQLEQLTGTIPFDAESATELLLYQSEGELVEEALRWFRWFRSSIPDPNYFKSLHNNGTDVAMGNATRPPNLLIESLDIEGEGRFAGKHLKFAGTIFDLASEPRQHPHPVTIELRAQGKQHLNIHCQLDRRGDRAIDLLKIQCPNLPWKARTLGEPNSLLITNGPASQLNAEIDIRIDGEQLTGTMIFRHSNVALHVDRLSDLVGGASTASLINQNISAINRFETTVHLSGTLENCQYRFESDLGRQLATAVASTTVSQTNLIAKRRSAEIQKAANERIAKLETDVSQVLDELQTKLNQNIHRTAELKSLIESPDNQSWPRIR